VGLVPAVSLLCYGSTESDPVAYVVSPFKRRDGTIPLQIKWFLFISLFPGQLVDGRRKGRGAPAPRPAARGL